MVGDGLHFSVALAGMSRRLAMFVFFAILLQTPVLASSKQIAFTFDDAPRYSTTHFSGPNRAKHLIAELNSNKDLGDIRERREPLGSAVPVVISPR